MDNKKIKWACIQPLTGGMYIGALEAIGHDAEWILSYEGLDVANKDKDGNFTVVANEYNLLKWLEKNNHNVPYYKIQHRPMFDSNICEQNIDITLNGEDAIPDYKDIDLIVAVPVCSGLSNSTRAGSETKEARNCNMLFLANYVLSTIHPTVYCFENAPTLVAAKGDDVRLALEDIAMKNGYSVLYYKTDTVLHHNCQRRPRTFVIFFKWEGNGIQFPYTLGYENESMTIPEFFGKISENAPQHIGYEVKSAPHNYMVIDFLNYKYGDEWTKTFKSNLMHYLIKDNLIDEFKEFITNSNKYNEKDVEKAIKYVDHIFYKKSIGMNYYSEDVCLFRDYFPSVQFRNITNVMHYSGKRFCTIREFLSMMGMPEDFILYGNESNLNKIGQNVPAGTAKFIVERILNVLENPNPQKRKEGDVILNYLLEDNTKQKVTIC